MWNKLVVLLATGLGTGYAPVAPGTFGSIVGFLFAWALTPLFGWKHIVTIVAFAVLSVWLAERARLYCGGSDPQKIVIDEIIGCLVTMAGHPWDWKLVIVGFAAFRLFDIVKPFPCRQLERLPGGLGIVADDIVAGFYAWGVVWIVRLIW